jgi:hypothetical protein
VFIILSLNSLFVIFNPKKNSKKRQERKNAAENRRKEEEEKEYNILHPWIRSRVNAS